MARIKLKAKPKRTPHWRSIPDEILLAPQVRIGANGKRVHDTSIERAESLHPGLRLMDAFTRGDERAVAIIQSWKPTFVVVIV